MSGMSSYKTCGYCSYSEAVGWEKCAYHSGADSSYRHFKLYALKLENDKYYVGLTARRKISDRIDEHLLGVGARWTLMHKPIKVVESKNLGWVSKEEAENEENNLTLSYMDKYGTQNVRGGKNVKSDWILFRNYNTFTKEWFVVLWAKLIIFIILLLGSYIIYRVWN